MDLNIRQFKQSVLSDYRNAFLGHELRRVAMVESDCHFVTDHCDVAQVALARFVSPSDKFLMTGVDLTLDIARGSISPRNFFSSLFSSAYDAFAEGHVAKLSVAVGMAMAKAADASAANSDKGIVLCSIGGDFSADGEFFESVCFAAARSLPLAVILWNNTGAYTNGNLIRQLGGFGSASKSHRTLSIEAVRSDDYAALCRVMQLQVQRSRQGVTTLTFVDGIADSIPNFRKWILDKQIATPLQLDEVESSARQLVDRDRRDTYFASLVGEAPIRMPHRALIDITDVISNSTRPVMSLEAMPGIVAKAVGVASSGVGVFAEVSASDLNPSVLWDFPDVPLCLRTTDVRLGRMLGASPESCTTWTPASTREAHDCYTQILSSNSLSLVVEPGAKTSDIPVKPTPGAATRLADGEDVTIVSFANTTQVASDAVGLLLSQNIKAELIHLSSVRPLDADDVIANSVRKTKRLVVVDVDPEGRVASRILAELAQRPLVLRNLMSKPRRIWPKSPLHPVEPHDLCRLIAEMMNDD